MESESAFNMSREIALKEVIFVGMYSGAGMHKDSAGRLYGSSLGLFILCLTRIL